MAFAELTFPRFSGTPSYSNLVRAEVMQAEYKHELAILQLPVGRGAFSLVDEALLTGAPVMLEWGYESAANDFFLGYVDRVLPELGDGTTSMRIACVGASYPMKEGRQAVHTSVTAPQVAATIAARYGFAAEIEFHPRVYPMISQAGESDWALLARLAQEIGFTFFVRHTTLHFHSRQYRLDENRLNAPLLSYNTVKNRAMMSDTVDTLRTFNPKIGETGRSRLVTAGVDPALKRSHEVTNDGVDPQLGGTVMEPIFTRYTLGTAPTMYEADQELAGEQEAARYHLTAQAESRGSSALVPSALAYVTKVPASYEGYWWVSGATHRLTGSLQSTTSPQMSYFTELMLGRDGLEGSQQPRLGPPRRFIHDDLGPQGRTWDAPNQSVLTESGEWISTTLGLVQPLVDEPVPDYIMRRLQRVEG